jgi:hypothetical protein
MLPVLGSSSSALYLDAGDAVMAVLGRRAVQLPCSVLLQERSVARLAPDDRRVCAGNGELRWHSSRGEVVVRVVRRWTSARVSPVAPYAARVAELTAAVDVPAIDAASLLGRGPGLTPSGDDVLAGYLLARRAFGAPADALSAEILHAAPVRTTALSRTLLRLAAEGWCIPQVADLISSLGRPRPAPAEVRRLLAVGSSSGAALAGGIAAAASSLALGVIR